MNTLPRIGGNEADADDVRQLRSRAEPLRRGERLEDGEPEHDPGTEERDVLERVEGARLEGAFVEEREVPQDEVRRPDREGDQRIREHAESHHAGKREHRSEERSGQAGEEAQRSEVADEEVLRHVEREELLLSDLRDR